MYILTNSYGFKIGDQVELVKSSSNLLIKQSGALRRKKAPLSGSGARMRRLEKSEIERLSHQHAAQLGAVIGSSLGPIGMIVGAVVGSQIQAKRTSAGCRIEQAEGNFVELLCSESEYEQLARHFPITNSSLNTGKTS